MAAMNKNMGLALVVLALVMSSGAAVRVPAAVQVQAADDQSPPPANMAEGLACLGPVLSLIPCVDFLLGQHPNASPACCIDLTIFSNLSPHCICLLTNGGLSNYGLSLPKAKDLPQACNINAPKCN